MPNARLKICFVGSARYANPLDATTEKKFRLLNELGDVCVVGFSKALRPLRFTQYARFYALPQLPSAGLRYIEFLCVGCILTLWCIFRHDCRILIAQSPYEGAAAALAKHIAGWCGRKVALVVESHGDFESDVFLQRRIAFESVMRRLMRRFAGFSLRRADVLRAISKSTYCQLKAWRPDSDIIQFIAWTDIEAFFHAKATVHKLVPPLLLYVGVLIPRKGIIHLVNAFAAVAKDFPAVRLALIGKAENPMYLQSLKERIRELHLHDRIEFIPEMPQQELAQYMAQAHIFILPSLSEGLGRVVVEAMAAGTPVIGSRVGGIPDLINNRETGVLVPPGNEGALAESIDWVLRHPEKHQTMAEHAYHAARSFFSADTYRTGYQELCNAAQKHLTSTD